jgi:hypothetical protein
MKKFIAWLKKVLNYSESTLTYVHEEGGLFSVRAINGDPISELRHATIGGACMEAKRSGYAVGINRFVPRIISPDVSERSIALLFNKG